MSRCICAPARARSNARERGARARQAEHRPHAQFNEFLPAATWAQAPAPAQAFLAFAATANFALDRHLMSGSSKGMLCGVSVRNWRASSSIQKRFPDLERDTARSPVLALPDGSGSSLPCPGLSKPQLPCRQDALRPASP